MSLADSPCRVIAFHGGYLSPESMRRDMGDPAWVDQYLPSADAAAIAEVLPTDRPLILIGYSLGGSLIGHLSNRMSNIVGAVLYESALIGIDSVAGSFPVLWIRNRYKSTRRREREFADTRAAWKKGRQFDEVTGTGRHVSWRFGWPPIAHAWDRTLNPLIAEWIDAVQQSQTPRKPIAC